MRLDGPHVFSGSPSWPPNMEALGREDPAPTNSPPINLGIGLGMEVLDNRELNEHPSLSVSSYALRTNPLECLRIVGKEVRPCRKRPFTSHVALNVPGLGTRLQNFSTQVPLGPWVG